MNRRSALAMGLSFVGFAAFSQSQRASGEAGWVTLFDGKNLDPFNKIGDAIGASRTASRSPTKATASW